MRYITVRLLPDLRPSAREMGERIIRVRKLIEDPPSPLGLHFERQISGAFHARVGADLNQLRTVSRHGLLAFFAAIVWHDQDKWIAADSRRHRQRDAGIATGRLDESVSRRNITARFSERNHTQRRPILD